MRSRVSSLLWPAVVLVAGVLAVGCEDAGEDGASSPESPRSTADRADAPCTTTPEMTDDGYTAPGSNLCLGTTARVPYRPRVGAEPVPVEVTVTRMEPSTDSGFDPANPDLEGLPVWVYRFTVSSETALEGSIDPWEILNGVWTREGGANSMLLVNPGDCPLPFDLAAGDTAEGCKWAAVEHGTEILGVSWVSVADDRYSGIGESVNWHLDVPVTVP